MSDDSHSLRNGVLLALLTVALGAVASLGGIWLKGKFFPGDVRKDVDVSLMELMSATDSCFTTDRPNASLTFKNYGGRREQETNKFIQCGSFDSPELASGVYRFGYEPFPQGSRLIHVSAVAGIDEESHKTQTGTVATWIISYRDKEVCSAEASFRKPTEIECDVDVEETKADLSKLTIEQKVSPSSHRSRRELWAGLLEPTAIVETPK